MGFCINCGNKLKEDSKFCENCGASLNKIENLEELKECRYCKSKINKEAEICPHCRKRQPMGLNTRLNFFEVILILILTGIVFRIIYYLMFR